MSSLEYQLVSRTRKEEIEGVKINRGSALSGVVESDRCTKVKI